jgi:hypothetical protein
LLYDLGRIAAGHRIGFHHQGGFPSIS